MKQDHINYGMGRGSLLAYCLGFTFSLLLTVAAYLLVKYPQFDTSSLILQVVILGVIQLVVQLVFFLHLDRESSPRWNMAAFLFAFFAVVLLVAGTLWIMKNLDYSMNPQEVEQTIIEDEGFGE